VIAALADLQVAVEQGPVERTGALWVPNWSSASCDLGVLVYQPAEPIATSQVTLEGLTDLWNAALDQRMNYRVGSPVTVLMPCSGSAPETPNYQAWLPPWGL